MSYQTLNDASKRYKRKKHLLCLSEGSTKIWYVRREVGRDLRMGSEWLTGTSSDRMPPKPSEIEKTHILLGSVVSTDLEELYAALQGDFWSPDCEAKELILSKGLGHTSMSTGDVIEKNGRFFMVDTFGFIEVTDEGFKEITDDKLYTD